MNLENFAEYLKYPSRLYQLPYEELKSLTLQYPYCANFHLLLLIKSKLEGHPELEKNLARAAAYSVDRSYLRKLMQEEQLLPADSQITVGEDEILELKDLFSFDTELEKIPISHGEDHPSIPLSHSFSFDHAEEEELFLPAEEPIIGENSEQEPEQETPAEAFSSPELPPEPEAPPVPGDAVDIVDHTVPDAAAAVPPAAFFAPEEVVLQAGSSINVANHLSVVPTIIEREAVPALPPTVSRQLIDDCIAASRSLDNFWEQQSRREVTEWEWDIEPAPIAVNGKAGHQEKAPVSQELSGIAPTPKTSFKSFQKRYHRKSGKDPAHTPPAAAPEPVLRPKEVAAESLRVDLGIASETLAGLLVQQHQYDMAIQMYEHLSLLIPEKNAYFAAKIDAIKNL
jgi:hypothetical protein